MKQQDPISSEAARPAAALLDPAKVVLRDALADGWSHGAALLRSPRQVGSIVPSGKILADAVALEIPDGDGLVIELGGGTGNITAGLFRAGVAADRLVVVERDPRLCERLRRRFPLCTIVCGDACELQALLIDAGIVDPVKAVVSCLPILAMKLEEQERLLAEALQITAARGPLIQFTYSLRCPLPAGLLVRFCATAQRRAWIWQNLPPASVWRVRKN